MTSAIPGADVVQQTLDRLGNDLPGLDLAHVPFNLAVMNFATRAVASYEAHFARYGLSQARFAILLMLYIYPERAWTPALLAEQVSVTRATMTGLLKVCAQKDHIARKPDREDGRKTTIILAPAGENLLRQMLGDHFRRTADISKTLTADETRTLLALLHRLGGGLARLGA